MTRCPRCGDLHPAPPRTRRTTTERGYGWAWQQRSRAARQGAACAECGATTDLTLDHIDPLAQGGRGGSVRVLCRSCNSRLGQTVVGSVPCPNVTRGRDF